MSEEMKGIRDFPVNRVNPYKPGQHVTEDNSVSMNYIVGNGKNPKKIKTSGKKKKGEFIYDYRNTTRSIVRYNQINVIDYLDTMCDILKTKFGITRGGITMYRYLYEEIHVKNSVNLDNLSILVDPEKCKDATGYESVQSVFNGVTELLIAGIIARSGMTAVYFINPNFFMLSSTLVITEYFKVDHND